MSLGLAPFFVPANYNRNQAQITFFNKICYNIKNYDPILILETKTDKH